jgi:hypothetical protein
MTSGYEWDERTDWVARAIARDVAGRNRHVPEDAFKPGVMPSARFYPSWVSAINALREADRYKQIRSAVDAARLWDLIAAQKAKSGIEMTPPQGPIGVNSSIWWTRRPSLGRGTVKGFFKGEAVIVWENAPLTIPIDELMLSDPDLEKTGPSDIEIEAVARALARADHEHLSNREFAKLNFSWEDRARYTRLARAAIDALK